MIDSHAGGLRLEVGGLNICVSAWNLKQEETLRIEPGSSEPSIDHQLVVNGFTQIRKAAKKGLNDCLCLATLRLGVKQISIWRNYMVFRRGQKIEIFQKSKDESWENYMDRFVGLHGIITDPDASINDPDALVEVSLDGKGTHRLPQDCLRQLDN